MVRIARPLVIAVLTTFLLWLLPLESRAAALAVASWYGSAFDGRKTASGAIFDRTKLTAAHRRLPFGTVLRVERPGRDRDVLVTVNDRGPYVAGRDLDLSEAAARELGMLGRGVARVRYEVLTDRDGNPLQEGTVFYILVAESDTRLEAVIHSMFGSLMLERELGHFPNPESPGYYFIGCGPYSAFQPAEADLVRVRSLYPDARIILVQATDK